MLDVVIVVLVVGSGVAGLLLLFKRAAQQDARVWERIGEWDGGGWHIREHADSPGLMEWMSRQEWRDSDVWSRAVREERRMTVDGRHFDYRLIPQGDGLTLERRLK